MNYELFGISLLGKVEFLGHFNTREHVLKALDEFTGLGYKSVKYCKWPK